MSKIIPAFPDFEAAKAAVQFASEGTKLEVAEFLNRDATRAAEAIEGTVPASLRVQIPRPRTLLGMTVTVDGNSRVVRRSTEAPVAGEVSIDVATGVLRFNAADEGEPFVATVAGLDTVVTGEWLAFLQEHVRQTQEAMDGLSVEFPLTQTVYVDAVAGDDSEGDGTAVRPLKTLAAAVELIDESEEVEWLVQLGPGEYEYVSTPENNLDLSKRVSLRGAGQDLTTCIFRGWSERSTQQNQGEDEVYVEARNIIRFSRISNLAILASDVESNIVDAEAFEELVGYRPYFLAVDAESRLFLDSAKLSAGGDVTFAGFGTLNTSTRGFLASPPTNASSEVKSRMVNCLIDSEIELRSYNMDIQFLRIDEGHLVVNSATFVDELYCAGDASADVNAEWISGLRYEGGEGGILASGWRCFKDSFIETAGRNTARPGPFQPAVMDNVMLISSSGGSNGIVQVLNPAGLAPRDLIIRDCWIQYDGPYQEPGEDGVVSAIMFIGIEGKLTVLDTYVETTTIGVFVSHPLSGTDAGLSTHERPVEIRGCTFKCKFAAGGPADPHACVLLGGRGDAEIVGNHFIADGSDADMTDYPHGCIRFSQHHDAGERNVVMEGNTLEMIGPDLNMDSGVNRAPVLFTGDEAGDLNIRWEAGNRIVMRNEHYDYIFSRGLPTTSGPWAVSVAEIWTNGVAVTTNNVTLTKENGLRVFDHVEAEMITGGCKVINAWSNMTLTAADSGARVMIGNFVTVTLPAVKEGLWFVLDCHSLIGVGFVSRTGSPSFLGLDSIGGTLNVGTIKQDVKAVTTVYCDGTNWRYQSGDRGWVSASGISP